MKTNVKFNLVILVLGMTILTSFTKAEKAKSSIKEENITYIVDGVTMNGFIAYNSDLKGKRPAILVVPEWWGLNDYPKNRARQLASLGYIAMAVDMYGNGKIAADPKEAQALAGTFYQNPQLGKTRLDAAIKKIKEFQQTDPANVAAIGYCFGGSVVLNSAKLGSDLKGVVSFHGGLAGVKPDKNLLKAKILVCHGGSDKFVPQHDVDVFKHQLDSVGASYTVNVYPNATHAFSNPDATATGKKFNMPIEYNAEADKNSWNDMKMFFASLFK
jgi:dienelactone hydrolase